MSRETHFIRKSSNYLGIAIKIVLYVREELFAPVSVNSDIQLRRVIVNYTSSYAVYCSETV